MNRIIRNFIRCFIFLVAGCTSLPRADEPVWILFIGNSYTFANRMVETFTNLAITGGHDVMLESLIKGGYSLADHLADGASRSMFEKQTWNFVILQEKSSFPVSQSERENNMYPAIREWNDLVALQGGETILFMPWTYRDGYLDIGLDDYSQMQAEIANAHLEIGSELNLRSAPIGITWQAVLQQAPQLQAWDPDGSHPSRLGSFLAANVIYAVIFDSSPADILFTPTEVSEEDAQFITEITTGVCKIGTTPDRCLKLYPRLMRFPHRGSGNYSNPNVFPRPITLIECPHCGTWYPHTIEFLVIGKLVMPGCFGIPALHIIYPGRAVRSDHIPTAV